jgi:hypothetical protein
MFDDGPEILFVVVDGYMLECAGQRNACIIRAKKNELQEIIIISHSFKAFFRTTYQVGDSRRGFRPGRDDIIQIS